MSLKFRLAFLYTLSVFVILLVSALSIFLFNENFRKEEFFKRLELEGQEGLQMFVHNPSDSIVEELNRAAVSSTHELKIFIFDSAYNTLYTTLNQPPPPISKDINTIPSSKVNHFSTENGKEYVLFSAVQKEKLFFVIASGFDFYGRRKSDNLKVLLAFSVIGGLLLSGFLAFFYVRHAMFPLDKLKRQIEKINEKNLKERILVGNNNNEVWEIAKNFNAMLDRLEEAFEQRKNFVQHASHELRTPLANMLSQTEAALGKNMSAEECRRILVSLKEDQQDLIELTNSLLTLSRYEKVDRLADCTMIRVDEVLYDSVDNAKQFWPDALVTVGFENVPESESGLVFLGNESLMRAAFQNLIKNGIHYSPDSKVEVIIKTEENGILMHFINFGPQIREQEQNRLFIPFFRGENAVNKKGYGLGLSIVQRIIHLHQGTIKYFTDGVTLNRFTIFLPSRIIKNPAMF